MRTVPFLKWAGGKRWLAPLIEPLLKSCSRLVEPFVGSGAIFFRIAPSTALLSDINGDLISAFRAIRNEPERVITALSGLRINRTTFERMKRTEPTDEVDRAVRLIYLNRTAFNGLYRVNQQGEFNVPFGCKPGTKLCDVSALRLASQALSVASIVRQDFRVTLSRVKPTDMVYVDPPYIVKHDNNGFRRYNEKIFSWDDQQELAIALRRLVKEGVRIVVSNAHHDTVRAMYPSDCFSPFLMKRTTCMAGSGIHRVICREWLLISNNFTKTAQELVSVLTKIK